MRSAGGLVDRLLRGRLWVGCVGLLLAGIVFLNVSLLGLNSGIAVTAEQAAELRRQNAELRMEVARLGSSERIQRVAESRGFAMPAPGDVTYVDADPDADGRRAALALRKAEPATGSEEVTSVPPTADAAPADAPTAADPVAATDFDAPVAGTPATTPAVPGTAIPPAPETAVPPVAGTPPEPPAG